MEGAMGGVCNAIEGDWESICRMLMDQDYDGSSNTNYDHLVEVEDDISLLMAGDIDIPSLFTPNYLNVDSSSSHDLPISSLISTTNITDELKHEIAPVLKNKKRARVSKHHTLKGKRKAQAKRIRVVDERISDLEKGIKSDCAKEKRAGRGAATDPQSLYARRRRERINERLRILQSLVPNGTKVDISTMLEEAVHYVKFLQMQIKLLSSDEMWMYAPLAYNGIDVHLYTNFSPCLLP